MLLCGGERLRRRAIHVDVVNVRPPEARIEQGYSCEPPHSDSNIKPFPNQEICQFPARRWQPVIQMRRSLPSLKLTPIGSIPHWTPIPSSYLNDASSAQKSRSSSHSPQLHHRKTRHPTEPTTHTKPTIPTLSLCIGQSSSPHGATSPSPPSSPSSHIKSSHQHVPTFSTNSLPTSSPNPSSLKSRSRSEKLTDPSPNTRPMNQGHPQPPR